MDGRQRGVQIAVAVARQRQLVDDARRAVVELTVTVVGVLRVLEPMELVELMTSILLNRLKSVNNTTSETTWSEIALKLLHENKR